MSALLERTVNGEAWSSYDIPFTYLSSVPITGGAQIVRMVTCTPMDGSMSLVSNVAWCNDASLSDEGLLGTGPEADAMWKRTVEETARPVELDDSEPDTIEVTEKVAAWRQAFSTAVSTQG
jgi:hypothetical protein